MQIAANAVVSLDYVLTNAQGQELDRSPAGNPLVYLHGAGAIVPGLERALEGRAAGDRLSVTLAPDDAYGPRNPEMVQEVPRKQFQGVQQIEAGMRFRASDGRHERVVTVTQVTDELVTVDANHPLAGVTLQFELTVVGVRPASAEELEHGHAHGADGHHDHDHDH